MTSPSSFSVPPGKGIVWLASYPRSGNTWLRFFIHSLLEVIAGVPDRAIKISEIGKYSRWESNAGNFTQFLDNSGARENFARVAAMRPQVQQAMVDRERSSFFVKTHLILASVNGTPTINRRVTKAAVYLVRDPRDVACSYAAHSGWSLDDTIEVLGARDFVPANGVHEVVSSWSRNVESWTTPVRPFIHVARYEDLVADPIERFRSIAEHLGLQPTEKQLHKAVVLSSFDRLQKQEVEFDFDGWSANASDRFFRRGVSGDWRQQLSTEQADRIVREHREQMSRFGYLDGP